MKTSDLQMMLERSSSLATIEIDGPLGDAWSSFCLGMRANQSVKKAIVKRNEWDDGDGVQWMMKHGSLRNVVFCNCEVSAEGLGLAGLTSLTVSSVGWGEDDIRALVRNGNASSLRSLDLSFLNIYDRSALVLAQWLRGNTSLTSLKFFRCVLTEEGLAALLDAAVVNTTLLELDLFDCALEDGQILLDRLPLIQGLHKLVLGSISGVQTDLLYSSLDQNQSIVHFEADTRFVEDYDATKVEYYGLRNRCRYMRYLSTSM